jgi:hypothetical protein
MGVNTSLISLLFPIADSLGISLRPWKDANNFYHVSTVEKNTWDFEISPGITIPLDVQTLGSYIREGAVGVFCHVIGDLYLYAYYLQHQDAVTILILDGSKFYKIKNHIAKYDVADKAFDHPPSYFVDWSKPAQKAAYRRSRTAKQWSAIDVGDLDNGQSAKPVSGANSLLGNVGDTASDSTDNKAGVGGEPQTS